MYEPINADINEKTHELAERPFIKDDRIPAFNLIVNMLFLKTIVLDIDIVGSDGFETAMRFHGNMGNSDYKEPLKDAQTLQERAAAYYGKPELETIPLGVDTKTINEAMKDSIVNELCNKLLKLKKDAEYEEFLNNLEYVLMSLSCMGGRVNRNREIMGLSPTLINNISNILGVKDEHTFADLASGYGISTLFILRESNANTILRDNAKDTLVLSEMLLIAAGKNISNTKVADIFDGNTDEDIKADRIFIDPPFRTTYEGDNITSIDGIELKDAWVASIMKSVKALNDDGMAIIAVPAIVLHGVQNGLKEVRQYLLDNHLLQAVISLPRAWRNSSTPTHLLVISKRNNTSTRFVNLISNDDRDRIYDSKRRPMINTILTVEQNQENEKYLKDVEYSDISADSFIAGVYISYCETKDYRKDDIERKLDELYSELADKIARLRR